MISIFAKFFRFSGTHRRSWYWAIALECLRSLATSIQIDRSAVSVRRGRHAGSQFPNDRPVAQIFTCPPRCSDEAGRCSDGVHPGRGSREIIRDVRSIDLAMDRVNEVENTPLMTEAGSITHADTSDLVLKDVTFSYGEDEENAVIHGVNLTINYRSPANLPIQHLTW